MIFSKHLFFFLGIILCFNFSCTSPSIIGHGNIIKTRRSVSGFNKISMNGSGQLFLHQGEKESLIITCDQNIEPHIQSLVKNGTLEIGPKEASLKPSEPITYTLYLKNLNSLKMLGGILIRGEVLKTENLDVKFNGSGGLFLDKMVAQSMTIKINGSSKVAIESGFLKKQRISINGSGEVELSNLKSEITDINLNGSGKMAVWAKSELNIKLNGNGNVHYYGPAKVSQNFPGFGTIVNLGMK